MIFYSILIYFKLECCILFYFCPVRSAFWYLFFFLKNLFFFFFFLPKFHYKMQVKICSTYVLKENILFSSIREQVISRSIKAEFHEATLRRKIFFAFAELQLNRNNVYMWASYLNNFKKKATDHLFILKNLCMSFSPVNFWWLFSFS